MILLDMFGWEEQVQVVKFVSILVIKKRKENV
jgi:hypothetical protein